MPAVVSSMDFLAKSELYLTEKPYRLKFDPPSGLERTNIQIDTQEQVIEDIRGRENEFSIQKNGFCLATLDSEMSSDDYDDEQKIKDIYLPEIAHTLQELLGASRVQIFEHLVRKRHVAFPIATGQPYSHAQPTTAVHIDMTAGWGAKMARRLNHKIDVHELPSQNFQFYNVWKPIRGPVKDWPLAVCDASSIDQSVVVPGDVVFEDFVIENALIQESLRHKWYYVSDQKASEAWVFLQGDCMTRPLRGVPHTSFHHPDSDESVIPRESIEVRALVFYDDDKNERE